MIIALRGFLLGRLLVMFVVIMMSKTTGGDENSNEEQKQQVFSRHFSLFLRRNLCVMVQTRSKMGSFYRAFG